MSKKKSSAKMLDLSEVEKTNFNVVIGDPADSGYTVEVNISGSWSLTQAIDFTMQVEQLYILHQNRKNMED